MTGPAPEMPVAPHSPDAREKARLGVARRWTWDLLISVSGPGRQFGPDKEFIKEYVLNEGIALSLDLSACLLCNNVSEETEAQRKDTACLG